MAAASPRRAYAKLGSYEIAHVVRDQGLTPLAAWLFVTLTIQCDYRTRRWRGTALELARDTGMNRSTVARTVEALEALELVRVDVPFNRGGSADISVVAYDEIIIPSERSTPRSLDASRDSRPENASFTANPQASGPAMPQIKQAPMSQNEHATDKRPTCVTDGCGDPADRALPSGEPVCWKHEAF